VALAPAKVGLLFLVLFLMSEIYKLAGG